jgi:hypothetical protein
MEQQQQQQPEQQQQQQQPLSIRGPWLQSAAPSMQHAMLYGCLLVPCAAWAAQRAHVSRTWA